MNTYWCYLRRQEPEEGCEIKASRDTWAAELYAEQIFYKEGCMDALWGDDDDVFVRDAYGIVNKFRINMFPIPSFEASLIEINNKGE